jgi:hypothetical protein
MSPTPEMSPWSRPDANGIRVSTDRRRTRRLRRSDTQNAAVVGAWPLEWRTLTIDWLRTGGTTILSKSLLKTAGNLRHLAYEVMDALLEAGWVELEDQFTRNAWIPHQLTWTDADALRSVLGIRRGDAERAARETALAEPPRDGRLRELHESLAPRSARIVVQRVPLIQRLDDWIAGEHTGTRSEFTQFARGDDASIADNEWEWLAEHTDLEALGISLT